jgi:alkyl sulfatase BDS1-like metallo-beta-lactamase superfamily hydrolase
MNAGKPLSALMREIRLPEALKPAPGRGPVSWYVRSVWEEYSGWFQHRSTTELYWVPESAIWPELAELAGIDTLAKRAAAHVASGRPLEALHFIEIVLSVSPRNRAAREAQIAALERLLEETGGETYDELAWLEGELERARAALADA